MNFTALEIQGFRGFSTLQTLSLAVPDGKTPGSGLTIIVGPNNAGKSTITEAFRALANSRSQSFTEGRRNKKAGDRVCLTIRTDAGVSKFLKTLESGGSETEIVWEGGENHELDIFSLSSRRYFNPYFNKNAYSRSTYMSSDELPPTRAQIDEKSAYRLFEAQKHRALFDDLLGKIVSPVPSWTIDQSDPGQYYLRFTSGGQAHSSEGMGEGLVSIFVMVDALYDSKEGQKIVIDEPELSLHPAFQRKLARVFREYSANRQIICATHSPYFVDFEAIAQCAEIARVYVDDEGSKIAQLSRGTRDAISGFLKNRNNPHVLGLDARGVFFLEDSIILVEGQDDVVAYPAIAEQLNIQLTGQFYGWGIGGADNMALFAQILRELGFKRVFGLLDANKKEHLADLRTRFPYYRFDAIPTNDVRSKVAVPLRGVVDGLLDSTGKLKPVHATSVRAILASVNAYFAEA